MRTIYPKGGPKRRPDKGEGKLSAHKPNSSKWYSKEYLSSVWAKRPAQVLAFIGFLAIAAILIIVFAAGSESTLFGATDFNSSATQKNGVSVDANGHVVLNIASTGYYPGLTDKLVPLSAGSLFGTWINTGVGTDASREAEMLRNETDMGRRFDIDHIYNGWSTPFDQARFDFDKQYGRISMISWAKYYTDQILSGSQDSVITTQANLIKSQNRPIFLRWFWEMDGGSINGGIAQYVYENAASSSDLATRTKNYIAAWKYIHAKFAALGVTNAVWVWCPEASHFSTGTSQQYYPGNDQVDWICADGYNWNSTPAHSSPTWLTFAKIFDNNFYSFSVSSGKPAMIGETGTAEGTAADQAINRKAQWFTDFRNTVKASYPNMRAIVYFSSNRPEGAWAYTSSASAYSSFINWSKDTFFNTRGLGL